MTEPDQRAFAWEPLTPRGVAAFAFASAGRLFVVQFLVALVVAASVVWFLFAGWCPTIREGIERLPESGEIHLGRLDWRGGTPQLLAEGSFLAFTVDLERADNLRSPADVQVEFGREGIRVYSLPGHAEARYPADWIIAFNRKELVPWWGAWQPALLAIVGLGVIVGLLLVWYALATLYALPVWLMAFFGDRDLKLPESCRLAGAALLPGALLLAVGVLLYNVGLLDLVGLGFVTGGHLMLGWIYLFVSLLFIPKNPAATGRRNPFGASRGK